MAIHKLNIDDFDEVDYEVIAIHTTLEDFRLAYLTNQKLELVLHKTEQGIHTNTTEGETCFSSAFFLEVARAFAIILLSMLNFTPKNFCASMPLSSKTS